MREMCTHSREPETTTTTPSKMSVSVSEILGVSNRLTIGLAGASFSSCISSELRALLHKLVADELKRVFHLPHHGLVHRFLNDRLERVLREIGLRLLGREGSLRLVRHLGAFAGGQEPLWAQHSSLRDSQQSRAVVNTRG